MLNMKNAQYEKLLNVKNAQYEKLLNVKNAPIILQKYLHIYH